MHTTAAILAAMAALAAPGKSPYSVVPVAKSAPRPCDAIYSPLCRLPWYSHPWRSHVRVETAPEARKRYQGIAEVVREMTSDRPELMPYVLATAFHESGFRRDVHAGIGARSRGDCKMRKGADGKARCIPGSHRAICLMQVLRRGKPVWKTPRGYAWESLAGLDTAATRRCVQTGADILAAHYDRCRGGRDKPDDRCVMGLYFGARSPRRSRKATARAWTVRKVVRLLDEAAERAAAGQSPPTATRWQHACSPLFLPWPTVGRCRRPV